MDHPWGEGDNDVSLNRRRLLRAAVAAGGVGALAGLAAGDDCEDPTGPGCDDPRVGNPVPNPPSDGGPGGGGGGDCDIVVDPTATTDQNGDPAVFDTIQDAVDAATSGAVICVRGGTYRERVSIPGNKTDLVIYGVDSLEDTVVVPDSGSNPVFDLQATGVYVSGLDIRAYSSDGIHAAPGTVLDDSRIVTGDTTGLVATGSGSLLVVQDTEFQEVSGGEIEEVGRGIAVEGYRGDFAAGTGIYVLDCSFEDYARSVVVTDGSDVLVQGNTFTDAFIEGLHVESTTSGPTVENVYVRRNEFEGNTLAVTFVEHPDGGVNNLNVRGNNFEDCYFGIYTSDGGTRTNDYDGDGQEIEVPVAGALSESVDAACNYWNHPTGPDASDNEFNRPPNVPFVYLGSLAEGVQVTESVDYRPWSVAPRTTTDRRDDDLERIACVGGRRPV